LSSVQPSNVQLLKAIEELLDNYLKEGSLDKALTLYYVIEEGLEDAKRCVLKEFGSLKPYLQVVEDLNRAGISALPTALYSSRELARDLLSAREAELVQLLIKDSRELIEKLDPLAKRLVALALTYFENRRQLPSSVEDLCDVYEALTGEHIPEKVRRELKGHFYRLHLLSCDGWSPRALYMLKALRDKVPSVIFEFKPG